MGKNYDEKPIIAQIQPQCDEFIRMVKAEKKAQGKTNQDIADATGIPISNLSKCLSGNLANPSIYNAVAVCMYLGISLDEAFGLMRNSDESEHIKEFETIVHDLEKDLHYAERDIENLKATLKSNKMIIASLLGVCILLIASFGMGVIYDSSVQDDGFIKGSSIAPISIICITVIAIAITVTVTIIGKIIYRKEKG